MFKRALKTDFILALRCFQETRSRTILTFKHGGTDSLQPLWTMAVQPGKERHILLKSLCTFIFCRKYKCSDLCWYLRGQCRRSFPVTALSQTTHTVAPKQEPVANWCPFVCLSLASLSFPFPFENHVRDIGVNKEAIYTETKCDS